MRRLSIHSRTRNESFLVATILALAFLGAGCAFSPHPLEGKPAPNVQLTLLDGGTANLADYQGKNVVLVGFWATWCPPCRQCMTEVAHVARDYADRGLVAFSVNAGESESTVRHFLRDAGPHAPIALDPTGQVSVAFQASELPMTMLIDRDGTIRKVFIGVGPGSEDELRAALDDMLVAS